MEKGHESTSSLKGDNVAVCLNEAPKNIATESGQMQEAADRATLTLRVALTTFAEMKSAISAEAITALMNAKNIQAIDKQYHVNYSRSQNELMMFGLDGVAKIGELIGELYAKRKDDEDAAYHLSEVIEGIQKNAMTQRYLNEVQIQNARDTCKALEKRLTSDPNKTPLQKSLIDDRLFDDLGFYQDQQDMIKKFVDADNLQFNLAEKKIEALQTELEQQLKKNKIQDELAKKISENAEKKLKAEKERISDEICKKYADKQYEIKVRFANEELRAKAARESLEATCIAAGFALDNFTWVFVPNKTPTKMVVIAADSDGK